jgi:hypothetical protein
MHKLFAAPPEPSSIKDDVAMRANQAAQHMYRSRAPLLFAV